MFFSQEALQDMADSYRTMDNRAEVLIVGYATYAFTSARAREFATHGFARRLKTLVHCIEGVFGRLGPEDETIPTIEACTDATAYIQAFLFNVFGALDNLAWIWVEEKGIRNNEGNQIREERVGIGKKHREIRRTFSNDFRSYLNDNTEWFKHLADFRHALAHRIPLYIPQYAIVDQQAYEELQAAKEVVVDDVDEYNRLHAEQMKHVQFQPVMLHSISERSKRIVFHPQLLSDFAMVEEIGRRLLAELDRAIPPQNIPAPGILARFWKCLKSAVRGS